MQGEPRAWTDATKQRLCYQFPEGSQANSWDELLGIDAMKMARGETPSTFTQMAYRLAAHAARLKSG